MAFCKHPTYVRKARKGYQLQRGVPKDIQFIVGKSVWVESGGSTYREAHRRSPGFVARTDQEIALARGELRLSADELIDRVPKEYDLRDPEVRELLEEGASAAVELELLTPQQEARYLRVLRGEEAPRAHLSADELIKKAIDLKSPAQRTIECWQAAMKDFLSFASVVHPTAATRQQAIAYRSHLLEKLQPSTAKTRLAYLGGLWSVLHEIRPDHPHLFEGLNKRIKVERKRKVTLEIPDPDAWSGSQINLDIFRILYFTGARLSEIVGLRAEDILQDRILIRPSELRSLKTASSEREIPIHTRLKETVSRYRSESGYLWLSKYSEGQRRWGLNLSMPARKMFSASPKALRHRAATAVRTGGMNEAVVVALLGHTPNAISMEYGTVPWNELRRAVELL